MLRLKTILLAKIDQNGSKYMLQKNKNSVSNKCCFDFFLNLHIYIYI